MRTIAQIENTDAFLFCDPLPLDYTITKMKRLIADLEEAVKQVMQKETAVSTAFLHNMSDRIVVNLNHELVERKSRVKKIHAEIVRTAEMIAAVKTV